MSYYGAIVLKTVVAIILSGIIGIERQSKRRPAGFRTHILVCLGSMMIMILSESMFIKYNTLYGATPDPARLTAQVISGIGFLGAGTIVHYGANVRGLTTAASLWTVAAIGLTVGAGFYFLAFVATGAIYASLFIFNKISMKVNDSGNILELIIHVINKPKAIGAINLVVAKHNAQILDMDFANKSDMGLSSENENKLINVHLVVKLAPGTEITPMITSIEEVSGVVSVERI